ncbi:MAG: zeta toxin family protein, partial [Bdellovibrio sp.]|nr:zeta toxin family protein [Methylotenera sp.]
MSKKIIIIAGPNGAGKTTFAREYLPNEANCPIFINADLIAAGLAPFAPETVSIKAVRLMLNEIKANVKAGNNFAFETTLSGKYYATQIPAWQKLGYKIKLIFLALPNSEMAIKRVAARVASGGHNIPENVIKRRFEKGLHNYHHVYKPIV